MMMKVTLGALAVVAVCVVTLLTCEGIYAIARWSEFDGSVTYKTYELIRESGRPPDEGRNFADEGPPFTRLLQRNEIEPLLPKLRRAGVALGNSPYKKELKTVQAAINMNDDSDCLVQKPNINKNITFLRSNLFEPFDPLTIFYDSRINLDPEIRKIVETYGLRLVRLTTNEHGERTTVPVVTSHRKVIIAGDSVANGATSDDSETIASQLQALDLERQYINLGISGARPSDIVCALKRSAQRYPGQIDELIYVYCENDFGWRRPYGNPDEVIVWLKDFAKVQGIAKVTVVYAPYIYNVVPHYTRFRRYKGENHRNHEDERAALAELVREAGFRYIDITDLALAEVQRAKTQFAALSVFSDHVHLSPYGTARLVERLRRDSSALFGQRNGGIVSGSSRSRVAP